MSKRRPLTVFMFLISLIFFLPGFGCPTAVGQEKQGWLEFDAKAKPVRGGIFRIASVQYVGLMNPNHWPVNDWSALTHFYERLVYRDGQYRESIPYLVENWKYIDPLTVISTLRKGVQFHDGSPFNAENTKYQIDWIMDAKNGTWNRAYLRTLKSVEVVDEYTLKWNFKNPWAAFAGSVLAGIPGWPVSAEALKKDPKYVDTHPVGTGQFMLQEANPGNYLIMKRNPNWWFAKFAKRPDMPYFDGVKISVIPDPSVQLANLRAGQIDSLPVEKSLYALLKDDRSLKVFVFPGNHTMGLRFNHAKGPCQDIRVRQAISQAINRKALISGTQFGLGRIASCIFPEDHWCHNPQLKPVAYDPEKSKKLLTEAGYPNGLTLKGFMGNAPTSVTITEAIRAMLGQVGINWEVDALDPAAGSDRMKNLEYDLAAGGYAWIWEPDLVVTNLYHPNGGFNYGRSKNDKAIALIEAGKNETDLAKRQKVYFELEKALYDNYEDAWIWWEISIVAYRNTVMGYDNERHIKYREGYDLTHPLWFKDGKQ